MLHVYSGDVLFLKMCVWPSGKMHAGICVFYSVDAVEDDVNSTTDSKSHTRSITSTLSNQKTDMVRIGMK